MMDLTGLPEFVGVLLGIWFWFSAKERGQNRVKWFCYGWAFIALPPYILEFVLKVIYEDSDGTEVGPFFLTFIALSVMLGGPVVAQLRLSRFNKREGSDSN